MGAYVRDQVVTGEDFKGSIITFGSPPVGNHEFGEWFGENFCSHHQAGTDSSPLRVSWRFVTRDEIAPMAPPLPYLVPAGASELEHAQRMIQVVDLYSNQIDGLNQQEMKAQLNDLARHKCIDKIIFDHNLASTIRLLRNHLHAL